MSMNPPRSDNERKTSKKNKADRLAAMEAERDMHLKKLFEFCEIDGKPVKVQILKGTGICSENCRKIRDNDLLPARTVV